MEIDLKMNDLSFKAIVDKYGLKDDASVKIKTNLLKN